jgi:siroheme synthase
MGTTRKAEIADPAMAGDTYVEITQLVKQRMIQMGIVPGYASQHPISMCVDFPLTKSGLDRKFGVSND